MKMAVYDIRGGEPVQPPREYESRHGESRADFQVRVDDAERKLDFARYRQAGRLPKEAPLWRR